MSPATIDRLLKPAKNAGYLNAVSATKPGSLLRFEIAVRRALDDMEQPRHSGNRSGHSLEASSPAT
ncbi:hypothetical protein E4J89_15265 [Arthrobacter sp. CAU 1506]|uniref:hypothetical protein n=1 Tax=Arthrobacter sp. CAU 1506 TaxID=2560052 RepID=UPI0010AD8A29|nr:hypothetical protein [Arthrobacter sp. CAU 1506]TJY67437.1 hypothetical protein E4J89_15265 [Arthrobacter sp. CAU 1506]